ncbi:NapC/NirT family cytochrome c [Aquimarina sp. D1M17]|uniref:NapC/NirT family cytochrome c n=1 Tax=Aquimarina acroporae TaxID=2937283 RepID=UPI0020C0FD5D|nr:NapC/NirT family cytochrome c [Aquimarina acroporae]MCK8520755.1 NapC/NirT family cytochrome c [Aquimarina acroporae]
MKKATVYIVLTAVLSMLMTISCNQHHEAEYHSLKDKIEVESIDFNGVSITSEQYIGDITTVEVKEGVHSFLIPERKGQITSFPCVECHTEPLQDLQEEGKKKAHWDIQLIHADEEIMNCATCHNGSNMNSLQSLAKGAIDINHSYKLCAQCHSDQFKDWQGGAHGKNIGGWTEPRVVMTCVNCHNPHQPKIQSRWPSRFNTQKVKERE